MSGHSKWANIKHKKAKEDSAKGKTFTKLVKELTIAAREGGGDATGNPRLRFLMEKARSVNMPIDNVTRAIKKGTGELEGVHYEEIRYEGYGPSGTAVVVEVVTDNKNRSVADIRHVFSKHGGNLGANGVVLWMFEHKGVIRATGNMSEDDLLEKLLDYNIDDVSSHDNSFTITCDAHDLEVIKAAVQKTGLKVEDAAVEWLAKNTVNVDDKNQEEKVFKFLGALEDLEDVQNVYTNLA
ncbi:MAG: YebC/PmpR family DNA-binding transcriptional regulator [bacterium]